MHEPTNRDILAAVEALGRDVHLFRDTTEARFSLIGERFDGLENRFDGLEGRLGGLEGHFGKVELTLEQHSQALKELAAASDVQAAALNRVERRLHARR